MPKLADYDHLIKLLLIGDSGTGKTNMLLRYCENNFLASHLTTIGIDFKIKTVDIDGKRIKMQIWDTAGQERFKTITQSYYKGAMGILLIYSVDDIVSFKNLISWMKQIKTFAEEDIVIVLAGNKTDGKREVSYQQGKQYAEQIGVNFFQTSAKNNYGIQQCFTTLARLVKARLCQDIQISVVSYTGSKLHRVTDQNKFKKKCC